MPAVTGLRGSSYESLTPFLNACHIVMPMKRTIIPISQEGRTSAGGGWEVGGGGDKWEGDKRPEEVHPYLITSDRISPDLPFVSVLVFSQQR